MAAPSSRPLNLAYALIFTLSSAAGLYFMRIKPVQDDFPVGFNDLLATKQYPSGAPLRTGYTGVVPIDGMLSLLVLAFMPGAAGWEPAYQMQQIHFFFNLYAIVSVMTVEAYRKRNQWRVMSYVVLFATVYQMIGGAAILPLYFLAYLQGSAEDAYFASGRQVPLHQAKVLMWALLLGYLVPTVAMFWPWHDLALHEQTTALWQVAPMLPNLLVWLFSFVLRPSPSESAKTADVKHLQWVYLAAGVIPFIAHITTLYICLSSPDPRLSLGAVFLPNTETTKKNMALGLLWLFQVDFWGIFATTLFWCWLGIADVVRLEHGQADAARLVKAAVRIAFLAVVAGPGAAVAVAWSWREGALVRIEERADKVAGKSKAA